MNTQLPPRIACTISLIKEVDGMIANWAKQLPNPAAKLMVYQLESQKRDFVQQLLADLIESPNNIADMEPFIHQATSYLKKFDRLDAPPSDLPASLKEIGLLIAPPVLAPMPA